MLAGVDVDGVSVQGLGVAPLLPVVVLWRSGRFLMLLVSGGVFRVFPRS